MILYAFILHAPLNHIFMLTLNFFRPLLFNHITKLTLLLVFTCSQLLIASDPENKLTDLLETHQAVGLSVGVVKDGEIVYTQAFGKKNLEDDTPLNTGDLFRIASISKSFSATSIMQFVEDGVISLDDDISDLIGFEVRNPHYPDTPITVRMMLSHTSSIGDSAGYFTLDTINPTVNPDWQNSYNNYEPGTQYEYCNLNFNMIGAVLERLSGTRFDLHIEEQILDPLGLYGGFNVNSLDPYRLAPLYSFNSEAGEFRQSFNAYATRSDEIENYNLGYSAPIFSPTGGMKMSAGDLTKYMIMHMNHGIYNEERIITEESARIMQTPVDEESGYGLALRTFEELVPGTTLVGHTGSAYGLYSIMVFDPEKKFGFVAITNGGRPERTDDVHHLLGDAVHVLYQEFIE